MPNVHQIQIKGLYTYPNPLGDVPKGSLAVADNVVIDADGVAQSRRGFGALTETFGSSTDRAKALFNYQEHVLAHYNDTTLAYRVPGVGFTNYSGTYAAPTGATMRAVEAASNFYFTTSLGVYKLDSYTGCSYGATSTTAALAGVPKAISLSAALTAAGSGFFSNNSVATVTGNPASGQTSVKGCSDLTDVAVGQYIYGTGVALGTTITDVSSGDVLSTTGDTHSNTTLDSIATLSGSEESVAVGNLVTGSGIPANTVVSSLTSGTALTLSASASTSITKNPIVFSKATLTLSSAASSSGTGVSLQIYSGSQVAYRVVWGIKDANNRVLLGAPSQRAVVTNTGTTSDTVTLTIAIPSGITTAHFYQVYRSAQTASASIEPNDELQQVYEGNPTSGEISAGSITVVDALSDALRGATIYTASSQEGILQANEPPPYCKDMGLFRECMLYANTVSRFRLSLTLVSAALFTVNTDTVTIAGTTYLAASTEDATSSPPKFKVATAGTAAQNIADTANSLVRVINAASGNTTIYATYTSGYTDLPGQMLLEGRSLNGSAFYATASAHGASFDPILPTSGTTIAATQDIYKNGIVVSKQGQPEAAPSSNVLFAGSAAFEILRIVPLRDSVFIFKEDGIFRLVGQQPSNFYIELFDNTSTLLAPDTCVNLNNTIYCLTNQGVVSVSDTGVSVVSRPIEGDLLTLFGLSLSGVASYSWGISYQSDRKYVLGTISSAGDTVATQIYVYNIFTNAWTRWTFGGYCGFVDSITDSLYIASSSANQILAERKSFSATDYIDDSFAVTVVSASGTSLVLSDATAIEVGDLLTQGSNVYAIVTAVTPATGAVTVSNDLSTWTAGSATAYHAISCVMQFQPTTADVPETLKQFSEIELFFRRAHFSTASVGFASDLSADFEDIEVSGAGPVIWGYFTWGELTWPPSRVGSYPVRLYTPLEKQRGSQLYIRLTHREAYGDFLFLGVNVKGRGLSERTAR